MISLLLALAAASSESAGKAGVAVRQEIRNGRLYDVMLAPSCKNKQPKCKPWQREWNDAIKTLPGDTVTEDGLILREVTNA